MAFTQNQNPNRPRPVFELRLGAIKAAIWRNDTENGARYNTTFSRAYREGEQWHNTDSFGRDDLLVVAKLADQAHSWIFAQARDGAVPSATPTAAPAVPDCHGGAHALNRKTAIQKTAIDGRRKAHRAQR